MRNYIAFGAVLASLASGCGESEFSQPELAALSLHALPPVPPSPTNQYADDPEAAALGQKFFFDPRFSGPLTVTSDLGNAGDTGRVACATCHDPANGGSDHRSAPGNTSLAAGFTGRNSPSVYNVSLYPYLFWDGRKDSVWSQALGPIESPVEHNFSRLEVAHLIFTRYRALYEPLFGAMPNLSDEVRFPPAGKPGDARWDAMDSADQDAVNRVFANFGKAIEAYERKLVHRGSAFDRFLEGDPDALSPAAKRGAKLFVGRAACTECHAGGAFSDVEHHNAGVPQRGPNVPSQDRGRADGIAQLLGDVFNAAGLYSDERSAPHLAGLAVTDADVGAFKTPGLRGVAQTAPYMHTGELATLRDVIVFYREGGASSGFVGQKDPAIAPLQLDDRDVDDLVAFLESLDGEPLPLALTAAPDLP